MNAGPADVFQIVEYRRDKWAMEKVPLALLLCLLGLTSILYRDSPPGSTTLMAVVLMLLVAAVAFLSALWLMLEARNVAIRALATAIVAIFILAAVLLHGPGVLQPGRPTPNDAEARVAGWMLVYGAIGWIAWALYRHVFPPKPLLMLSPAGVSYHLSWLRDLLIPWHEIRDVGALERTDASGVVHRAEALTVVLVPKSFYDRHIEPRLSSILGPPGIFHPKGQSMQIVLHYDWFSVDPKHIREPVEARWKAFRHEPPTDTKPVSEARQVYGRWSIDGSRWQAIKFLVPFIGIIAVLVHSAVRQL